MKRPLKVLILIVPLSLLLGLWWGLRIKDQRNRQQTEFVTLAVSSQTFSNEFADYLKSKQNIKLIEYSSLKDLIKQLLEKNNPIDIIEISSFHAQSLAQIIKFAPWQTTKDLQITNLISPDFKELLKSPFREQFLPIGWKTYGALVPSEQANTPLTWEKLFLTSNKNHPGLLFNETCLHIMMAKSQGLDFENWEEEDRRQQAHSQLRQMWGDYSQFVKDLPIPNEQAFIAPVAHTLGKDFEQSHQQFIFRYLDDSIPLEIHYLAVLNKAHSNPIKNLLDSSLRALSDPKTLDVWLKTAKMASVLRTQTAGKNYYDSSFLRKLDLNQIKNLTCTDEETANFSSLLGSTH